jgi:hypothetical protein
MRNPRMHGPVMATLATLLALAVLMPLYLHLFALLAINSDMANWLFAARDVADGNWRLHDWTLSPDNFWGLEVPVTAAVWSLTKDIIFTARLVPALNWLVLGAVCLVLATRGRKVTWTNALIVLAPLLLVPTHGKNMVTFQGMSPIHVLSVACIVGVIAIANRISLPGRAGKVLWAIYLLVIVNASASDPLFVVLGCLPVAIALAIGGLPAGAPRGKLILVMIGSVIAGRVLVHINAATGGFGPSVTNLHFVQIFDIPRSFGITLKSALDVLGCDLFGLSIQQAQIHLLRLPLLLIVGIPLYRLTQRVYVLLRHQTWNGEPPAFVDCALCLIVVTNIAVMLISGTVVDTGAIRYMLPAWAAASVLAARWFGRHRGALVYCGIITLVTLGADLQALWRERPLAFLPVDSQLAACLPALGLHEGYGTYWRASSVTLASAGRVRIRSVGVDQDGRIAERKWLSKSSWYQPFPFRSAFVVVTMPDDTLVPPGAVETTFGPPTSRFKVSSAIVFVYGRTVPPNGCQNGLSRPTPAISTTGR